MKITDIELFEVKGKWNAPDFGPTARQVQALDVYPEMQEFVDNSRMEQNTTDKRATYLEIRTDNGIKGLYGPISTSVGQITAIKKVLLPLLAGRDPLAIEHLHDLMLRADRHGRTGAFVTALSAVDCALWDLKGRAWEQPVYRLLGGPTRGHVPAYASMLGFSTEPERAAETAKTYKKKGFTAQKWFFRYGPGSGEEGLSKNIAMAEAVRGAVGSHYRLMFDAFMGWDMAYALQMAKALTPLDPFWLEEPLPPEHISGFKRLRTATAVPLSTGEHVYTRWQTKELLVQDAIDVLQNDPDWTGGISEQVKICALGSAFDVPVIAHGHSLLPALHVAGSQSPSTVPYVEYLIQHQESAQFFHDSGYHPESGMMALPERPGMGFDLDEEKVLSRREISDSQ